MEGKDKIIKDIFSSVDRERAPGYLYTQVMQNLEAERSHVFESKPLLPTWVLGVIILSLIGVLIYLAVNTTPGTAVWSALFNDISLPQLNWSLSVESKLLTQISKYALFLIPALLLQFLYINNYINGFKGVDIKK